MSSLLDNNETSPPADNPPAYTPFSYYNPVGAEASTNSIYSPNMFTAAGNNRNTSTNFSSPEQVTQSMPAAFNMSSVIPSYYMTGSNFIVPGFPVPYNSSPSPLGNNMLAYMPSSQVNPASIMANMPMPMGFVPPLPGSAHGSAHGSASGSVIGSIHMPMPPLSAQSRSGSALFTGGPWSNRATSMAASIHGSALQSPAVIRSIAGSVAGSAHVPGSSNPSRSRSRAESRAGSSIGNRAVSRAGLNANSDWVERSSNIASEPISEVAEKTPEQKAFEETKKFKMDLINKLVDGSVVVDTKLPGQAKIAQMAGAKAILVVGDDKKDDWKSSHNVARPLQKHDFVKFVDAVAIPVIGMIRIGHEMEAKVMERAGANMIDESKRLDTFSEEVGIDKTKFVTPFVCDIKDIQGALKRIKEGAALLRTDSSEDSSGDCQKTIAILHEIRETIEDIKGFTDNEVKEYAENKEVDEDLVFKIKKLGHLPVPLFAAGGIATPADVAQVRLIGCDGVFIETRVFRGLDPEQRVSALVQACKEYTNAKLIAELSIYFRPEPK